MASVIKEAEKEIKKEEKKFLKFIKSDIWRFSFIILAIVAVILLILLIVPKGMSANKAGEYLTNSLNERVGGGVVLKSVVDKGQLYEITVTYQTQDIPVYMTKDGKYMAMGVQELTESEEQDDTDDDQPTTIPKSNKPTAELFIWSYCPYGVTALTPFADVAKLLGNSADFKVRLYYDGHGAFETQQNKIQACMQKYDSVKYWDYAKEFASKIYTKCGSSRSIDCDKNESITIMKSLGIDSAKILTCVDKEGASLIAEDASRAQELGVTGSPTLTVNEVAAQVARTAEAYKTAICDAYNDSPDACDQALSNQAGTTSGSC